MIARRARVYGRVQGVFYRASAAERAAALGVSGHARNLADGSVEVLAVGEPGPVAALIDWLAHGPPLARVDRVETEELSAADAGPQQGFVTR